MKNILENFTYLGKRIPSYMYGPIEDYILHGDIDRDDFLWNVVTNNLVGVYKSADSTNINLIGVYVSFFYNEAPSNCWGSEETVCKWIYTRRNGE